MGKLCQSGPELWPLIDVILISYIELIFRGGVSCLPAALLFFFFFLHFLHHPFQCIAYFTLHHQDLMMSLIELF